MRVTVMPSYRFYRFALIAFVWSSYQWTAADAFSQFRQQLILPPTSSGSPIPLPDFDIPSDHNHVAPPTGQLLLDPTTIGVDRPMTKQREKAIGRLAKMFGANPPVRTPGSVLRQMVTPQGPKKPKMIGPALPGQEPIEPALDELRRDIVIGNFKGIGKYLSELPPDEATALYGELVSLMASGGTYTMLPGEIIPLCDLGPSEPDRWQLAALGRLLSGALQHADNPQAVLRQLKLGTRWLGGADRSKRIAAAHFLLAAGLDQPAETFLPPLDDVAKTGDAQLMNLAARIKAMRGKQRSDSRLVAMAWQLSVGILELDDAAKEQRGEALVRLVGLLHLVSKNSADEWLRSVLSTQKDLTGRLLVEISRQVKASFRRPDITHRIEALKAQHLLIEQLLSTGKDEAGKDKTGKDDLAPWSGAMRMMAILWINEAQKAVGNESRRMIVEDDNKIAALSPKMLKDVLPSEEWCRQLDPDTAGHMRRLSGILAARCQDEEQMVRIVGVVKAYSPQTATDIAEEYVQYWRGDADSWQASSEELPQTFTNYGVSYSQNIQLIRHYQRQSRYQSEAGSISLTRSRQVRDLKHLAKMLQRLSKLELPPLDGQVLSGAFETCYADAEIYRGEDVERVFGSLKTISPETLAALAMSMRQKLAQQWRNPELQDQGGTKRTDKELIAEIKRGYLLAIKLLENAAQRQPNNFTLPAILGSIHFDRAEFLYGQEVELKTYTAVRDQAFAAYRKGAQIYATRLPSLKADEYSVDVFRRWFQSALGASDLAALTRKDKPDRDQIEKLRTELLALGEAYAEDHLTAFGQSITDAMGELPPHLKPHYLREAIRILGDHRSADSARRTLAYYDELLGELELRMVVDGPSDVGHGAYFGAELSLRSTTALLRESGQFAALRTNDDYGAGDTKKSLTAELRDKLGESFEIDAIRFLPPTATARGFGRDHWREMPIAYLVLRVKDPSVDRLPPIQLDLPFQDRSGLVLLGITSPVVLINARNTELSARPADQLAITQLLDDRQLAEGMASLEISATALGIVPDLESLFDMSGNTISGFTITEVKDHGLDVEAIDTTGDQVRPSCRRSWQLKLKPNDKAGSQFTFLKSIADKAESKYERFEDADVVEVASTVPISFPNKGSGAMRLWIASIAGGTFVLLAVLLVWRGRRSPAGLGETAGAPYRRPAQVTPFNLVTTLERMHIDESISLTAAERGDLAAVIQDLQRRFFGHADEPCDQANLEQTFDRWHTLAVGGQ